MKCSGTLELTIPSCRYRGFDQIRRQTFFVESLKHGKQAFPALKIVNYAQLTQGSVIPHTHFTGCSGWWLETTTAQIWSHPTVEVWAISTPHSPAGEINLAWLNHSVASIIGATPELLISLLQEHRAEFPSLLWSLLYAPSQDLFLDRTIEFLGSVTVLRIFRLFLRVSLERSTYDPSCWEALELINYVGRWWGTDIKDITVVRPSHRTLASELCRGNSFYEYLPFPFLR